MSTVIVKVQRQLNDDQSMALIYTRDRSINQFLPFDDALKTAMGDQYKAYFEARIHDDGMLGLVRQVKARW